ncbi:hypothetical protein WDU94_005498 [Cyamophila willieti]
MSSSRARKIMALSQGKPKFEFTPGSYLVNRDGSLSLLPTSGIATVTVVNTTGVGAESTSDQLVTTESDDTFKLHPLSTNTIATSDTTDDVAASASDTTDDVGAESTSDQMVTTESDDTFKLHQLLSTNTIATSETTDGVGADSTSDQMETSENLDKIVEYTDENSDDSMDLLESIATAIMRKRISPVEPQNNVLNEISDDVSEMENGNVALSEMENEMMMMYYKWTMMILTLEKMKMQDRNENDN